MCSGEWRSQLLFVTQVLSAYWILSAFNPGSELFCVLCNDFYIYLFYFIFMCFVYMRMCMLCILLVYKKGVQEEGAGHLGTGMKDTCKLPCECWEWYPGLLQEHLYLLNDEPSFQPTYLFLKGRYDIGLWTSDCEVFLPCPSYLLPQDPLQLVKLLSGAL